RGTQVSGSVERVHFRRGNDHAGAAVAVLRTFLTMASLSAFWIASSWNYGASAMLLATIFSGLLASSPNPLAAASRTAQGYVAGMLAAFVLLFVLLPGSDGFAMLIAASAGLLVIGSYLRTRDSLPGVGAGYMLGFVYILALKNPMVYDPVHFFNEAIAQVAGLGLAGVAFMIVPAVTGTGWQRARLLRRLREQVTLVASEPLPGLAYRFESVSRDLFQQVVAYTTVDSKESRDLLAWGLAVQESGRAVLELRQQLSAGELPAPVRDAAQKAVQAVARLYQEPSAASWHEAEGKVRAAVTATASDQSSRLHLYQLLSALRDDESPLAVYISPPEPADAA
ncbi:MAG: FUSC family protein, partial [Rhodanobacter sp.]